MLIKKAKHQPVNNGDFNIFMLCSVAPTALKTNAEVANVFLDRYVSAKFGRLILLNVGEEHRA